MKYPCTLCLEWSVLHRSWASASQLAFFKQPAALLTLIVKTQKHLFFVKQSSHKEVTDSNFVFHMLRSRKDCPELAVACCKLLDVS